MKEYFVGKKVGKRKTHAVHEASSWSACGLVKSGPWQRVTPMDVFPEPTCSICYRKWIRLK